MQPRSLYFMGDIHGDFGTILRYIMIHDVRDADILQLGDFGLGFMEEEDERKLLARLNIILRERSIQLYAIRGNHDKPTCFRTPDSRFSQIRFLPDYTVLRLRDKNILCVGGALSIDRCNREQNINYWVEECFQLDEEKLRSLTDIDIVATHNGPDLVYPFDIEGINHIYFRRDPTLRVDLSQERLDLTKMYQILSEEASNSLTHWFYGHYHSHHIMEIDRTQFILLDIDQTYPFEDSAS